MSEQAVIAKLDELLRPLGFKRQRAVWNRGAGFVVEVIDVQVSKAGDSATVNAGVLDTEVHANLWPEDRASFVEEPTCTVRARIGQLIDGKDLWWPLDDEQVGEKMSTAVSDHILPFVKRMRSRQEMVRWLTETQVAKKRYPPPIINLALLQNFLGKSSEACALLAEVEKKAGGAWRGTAAEIAERLGCAK